MPIEIKSTRGYRVDAVKMVVYGTAGSGKTVLCSTAPKPIIISAEHGLLSLASLDIPYIEVKTLRDIGDAFNMLKKDTEFKTICLDSVSEISEVLLTELKQDAKDARQAYGKLADSLGAMLRNFRDIKQKNIVMTAKQKSREDELAGTIEYMPSLPGRVLPESLPYIVDEVLVMKMAIKKGKTIRTLQTQPDRQFVAKDRSGALNQFEEPDLTAIFNKIIEHSKG